MIESHVLPGVQPAPSSVTPFVTLAAAFRATQATSVSGDKPVRARLVQLLLLYYTTWKVMSQISDALKNSPFEIKGL
jgi:hypothetical protein